MQITTVGNYPVTLGWLLALVIVILCIVFLVVGLPDARVVLFLIGGTALARLI